MPSSIKVYDFTSFTLLDYPDTPAAIIWLAGCNMRCPYCHNADIVLGKNRLSFEEVLLFLKKRRRVLEGVVFSGGEPTLHPYLTTMLRLTKELGYKNKLDTNASRPNIVQKLLEQKLLDFVAIDFKAPKEKYQQITGIDGYENFCKTLKIVQKFQIDYEVRTTVHSILLNETDINSMIRTLQNLDYQKTYFLQNFRDSSKNLMQLPEHQPLNYKKISKQLPLHFRN
ncbi:anaerobic ribonucleoside-triphosphate reductase activating protein [Nitratiruptor sp. YY09-18]|uniref:anaerobic ribonucleoside-triphosphate reductase activating protein n=1 Tax=Nitratiruptor sp. YY09-18 TaxID=2724901 RepID=UPI00191578F5|nr:anaerobic ribonucleoside-triphosphate reductase activating protein [Nitratiruptor sp. YY09-18]BCD67292.1 pyruvate formate lyase activating enzyme [Nitratiruptor sp. YY09-18]